MGHVVLFDQLQAALRIEAIHHDDRATEALRAHRPGQRCGVIQRRGTEVHAVVAETERDGEAERAAYAFAERTERQLSFDALRPARRPRRIQHEVAFGFVVDRFRRKRADDVVVALPAVELAVEQQAGVGLGGARGVELGGHARELTRRHEDRRVAVVDDVRGLVGGEV